MRYTATVRRTVIVEIEAEEGDDRVQIATKAAIAELGGEEEVEVLHIEPMPEPEQKII